MTSTRRFILVAGLALAFHCPLLAGEPVTLYLVAGQSNALGVAVCGEPWCDPQPDVRYFDTRIIHQWIELQPRAPLGYFGPELSGGRTLADELSAPPIAVFKHAKGGSSLCVDWDPSGGGEWNSFVNFCSVARGQLTFLGYEPEIAGLIWMQGESDTSIDCRDVYEANLTLFIEAVRDLVGVPDLPVAIGEVADANWGSQGAIRTAQMNVAAADRRAGFVPTGDLPLQEDGIHFDAAAQLTLGVRFADELIRLRDLAPSDVYGDDAVNVPDLLALLAAWGPCGDCAEDINDDGAVNVPDLIELLQHWE